MLGRTERAMTEIIRKADKIVITVEDGPMGDNFTLTIGRGGVNPILDFRRELRLAVQSYLNDLSTHQNNSYYGHNTIDNSPKRSCESQGYRRGY